MVSFPYSNSKPLTQRCFRKTQHQLSGRNPRRKSLTSRESFHLRNMALRSPRGWRLQMFPAQSAGHQGRSAFCPCVLGAIGPPSPAVLVSRLTVTIATLQLPPALQASPGLELAALRAAIPVLTLLFPEQWGEDCGEEKRGGQQMASTHETSPHRLGNPAKPSMEIVFRDPHHPQPSEASVSTSPGVGCAGRNWSLRVRRPGF